jgi:putative FmdB family regulatory protein
MPLYEFACNACGREFEELFRSRSERRRMACPGCHSRDVRKRFSTFATAGGDRSKGRGSGGGCATCQRSSCASCRP